MKRVTCAICKQRRIPWWRKTKGYCIERIYEDEYFRTTVVMSPKAVNICAKCVKERLRKYV